MSPKRKVNTHPKKQKKINDVVLTELSQPPAPKWQRAPADTSAIHTLHRTPEYDPRAKRLMWLGVTIISAIIFALWGWSLAVQFSLFDINRTQEKSLLNTARNEWNSIYATTRESPLQKKLDNKKIENAIREIIANRSTTDNAVATTSAN